MAGRMVTGGALVWLAATAVFTAQASQGSQGQPAGSPPRELLQVMRAINTGQAAVHQGGRYGRLRELPAIDGVVVTSDTTGRIGEHTVTVITDAAGQGYAASVVPAAEGCGVALFSRESGVIYTATPLGCR